MVEALYIYYDDQHFVKLTGNNCHFIYFGNTLEKQIMREIDGITIFSSSFFFAWGAILHDIV